MSIPTPRLTLGYRQAQAPATTLVSEPSAPDDSPGVWGHEFHRTQTLPAAGSDPAWVWNNSPAGFSLDPAGLGEPTLHSSYLHLHWAGTPQAAQRFADAASRHAARNQTPTAGPRPRPAEPDHDHDDDNDDHEPPATRDLGGIDLHHHGDRDVADGLIDLAVNVQTPGPRPWLARIIDATTASYFLAIKAGMIPSQSCATRVHWACMRSHRARASSGVAVGPSLAPMGLLTPEKNSTWAPSIWRVRSPIQIMWAEQSYHSPVRESCRVRASS